MLFAQEYLDTKKIVYDHLLEYIDNDDHSQINFQKLIQIFDDQKLNENQHELQLLLHLITKISNNHHKKGDFFNKIEQILKHFEKEIKKNFSNFEIFNFFKSNKRILLFLIEEKIITIDKYIASIITNEKYTKRNYHQYFYPEIKPFIDEEKCQEISEEIPEKLEEERKSGNLDSYIAKLIQQDSIKEFISHINHKNISIHKAIIETSISETNSFLFEKDPTFIEYAAFCGSIQIFRYLQMNQAKLTESLWLYTIHGKNAEIIHMLEENHIQPPGKSYFNCFIESVKCHHNEIANYFKDNLLKNFVSNFNKFLKSYNFDFIIIDGPKTDVLFGDLCKYDYYTLAEMILNNENIDVNKKVILKFNF